jgi:hypothetical protein
MDLLSLVKIINSNKKLLLLIAIIFGTFLRFNNFYASAFSYWFDEQFTFYVSNPNNNLFEFKKILDTLVSDIGQNYNYDITPIYYYYLIQSAFKFFGYNPLVSSTLVIVVSCISIVLSYYISRIITKNFLVNFSVILLFSLNPFLIMHSQEVRVQSFVVLFFLVNLFFFLKILSKFKKYYFFYFLSLVNLMFIAPTTYAIIFSQIVLIVFSHKNLNVPKKKIFFCLILAITFYLFLNVNYISAYPKIETYHIFYKNFFLGLFFNRFFGSIFAGGLFLLLFTFLLFIWLKKDFLFKDSFLNLNLIIIFSGYSGLIIYSLLFSPIIKSQYIIFVVPCILFFIIHSIDLIIKNNNFKIKIIVSIIFIHILITIFYTKKEERNFNYSVIFENIGVLRTKNLNTVSINSVLETNYILKINEFFNNKFKIIKNNYIGVDEFYILCKPTPLQADLIKLAEICEISSSEHRASPFYSLLSKFYKLDEVIYVSDAALLFYKKTPFNNNVDNFEYY